MQHRKARVEPDPSLRRNPSEESSRSKDDEDYIQNQPLRRWVQHIWTVSNNVTNRLRDILKVSVSSHTSLSDSTPRRSYSRKEGLRSSSKTVNEHLLGSHARLHDNLRYRGSFHEKSQDLGERLGQRQSHRIYRPNERGKCAVHPSRSFLQPMGGNHPSPILVLPRVHPQTGQPIYNPGAYQHHHVVHNGNQWNSNWRNRSYQTFWNQHNPAKISSVIGHQVRERFSFPGVPRQSSHKSDNSDGANQESIHQFSTRNDNSSRTSVESRLQSRISLKPDTPPSRSERKESHSSIPNQSDHKFNESNVPASVIKRSNGKKIVWDAQLSDIPSQDPSSSNQSKGGISIESSSHSVTLTVERNGHDHLGVGRSMIQSSARSYFNSNPIEERVEEFEKSVDTISKDVDGTSSPKNRMGDSSRNYNNPSVNYAKLSTITETCMDSLLRSLRAKMNALDAEIKGSPYKLATTPVPSPSSRCSLSPVSDHGRDHGTASITHGNLQDPQNSPKANLKKMKEIGKEIKPIGDDCRPSFSKRIQDIWQESNAGSWSALRKEDIFRFSERKDSSKKSIFGVNKHIISHGEFASDYYAAVNLAGMLEKLIETKTGMKIGDRKEDYGPPEPPPRSYKRIKPKVSHVAIQYSEPSSSTALETSRATSWNTKLKMSLEAADNKPAQRFLSRIASTIIGEAQNKGVSIVTSNSENPTNVKSETNKEVNEAIESNIKATSKVGLSRPNALTMEANSEAMESKVDLKRNQLFSGGAKTTITRSTILARENISKIHLLKKKLRPSKSLTERFQFPSRTSSFSSSRNCRAVAQESVSAKFCLWLVKKFQARKPSPSLTVTPKFIKARNNVIRGKVSNMFKSFKRRNVSRDCIDGNSATKNLNNKTSTTNSGRKGRRSRLSVGKQILKTRPRKKIHWKIDQSLKVRSVEKSSHESTAGTVNQSLKNASEENHQLSPNSVPVASEMIIEEVEESKESARSRDEKLAHSTTSKTSKDVETDVHVSSTSSSNLSNFSQACANLKKKCKTDGNSSRTLLGRKKSAAESSKSRLDRLEEDNMVNVTIRSCESTLAFLKRKKLTSSNIESAESSSSRLHRKTDDNRDKYANHRLPSTATKEDVEKHTDEEFEKIISKNKEKINKILSNHESELKKLNTELKETAKINKNDPSSSRVGSRVHKRGKKKMPEKITSSSRESKKYSLDIENLPSRKCISAKSETASPSNSTRSVPSKVKCSVRSVNGNVQIDFKEVALGKMRSDPLPRRKTQTSARWKSANLADQQLEDTSNKRIVSTKSGQEETAKSDTSKDAAGKKKEKSVSRVKANKFDEKLNNPLEAKATYVKTMSKGTFGSIEDKKEALSEEKKFVSRPSLIPIPRKTVVYRSEFKSSWRDRTGRSRLFRREKTSGINKKSEYLQVGNKRAKKDAISGSCDRSLKNNLPESSMRASANSSVIHAENASLNDNMSQIANKIEIEVTEKKKAADLKPCLKASILKVDRNHRTVEFKDESVGGFSDRELVERSVELMKVDLEGQTEIRKLHAVSIQTECDSKTSVFVSSSKKLMSTQIFDEATCESSSEMIFVESATNDACKIPSNEKSKKRRRDSKMSESMAILQQILQKTLVDSLTSICNGGSRDQTIHLELVSTSKGFEIKEEKKRSIRDSGKLQSEGSADGQLKPVKADVSLLRHWENRTIETTIRGQQSIESQLGLRGKFEKNISSREDTLSMCDKQMSTSPSAVEIETKRFTPVDIELVTVIDLKKDREGPRIEKKTPSGRRKKLRKGLMHVSQMLSPIDETEATFTENCGSYEVETQEIVSSSKSSPTREVKQHFLKMKNEARNQDVTKACKNVSVTDGIKDESFTIAKKELNNYTVVDITSHDGFQNESSIYSIKNDRGKKSVNDLKSQVDPKEIIPIKEYKLESQGTQSIISCNFSVSSNIHVKKTHQKINTNSMNKEDISGRKNKSSESSADGQVQSKPKERCSDQGSVMNGKKLVKRVKSSLENGIPLKRIMMKGQCTLSRISSNDRQNDKSHEKAHTKKSVEKVDSKQDQKKTSHKTSKKEKRDVLRNTISLNCIKRAKKSDGGISKTDLKYQTEEIEKHSCSKSGDEIEEEITESGPLREHNKWGNMQISKENTLTSFMPEKNDLIDLNHKSKNGAYAEAISTILTSKKNERHEREKTIHDQGTKRIANGKSPDFQNVEEITKRLMELKEKVESTILHGKESGRIGDALHVQPGVVDLSRGMKVFDKKIFRKPEKKSWKPVERVSGVTEMKESFQDFHLGGKPKGTQEMHLVKTTDGRTSINITG